MPLARGSAFCGYVSLLGAFLAAGAPVRARMPQVRWCTWEKKCFVPNFPAPAVVSAVDVLLSRVAALHPMGPFAVCGALGSAPLSLSFACSAFCASLVGWLPGRGACSRLSAATLGERLVRGPWPCANTPPVGGGLTFALLHSPPRRDAPSLPLSPLPFSPLPQSYQTDWEAILSTSPEDFIASVSAWMLPPEVTGAGAEHAPPPTKPLRELPPVRRAPPLPPPPLLPARLVCLLRAALPCCAALCCTHPTALLACSALALPCPAE